LRALGKSFPGDTDWIVRRREGHHQDCEMISGLCRRLADSAGGGVSPVGTFRQSPARVLDVADRVFP
jgi:hypothetical protein